MTRRVRCGTLVAWPGKSDFPSPRNVSWGGAATRLFVCTAALIGAVPQASAQTGIDLTMTSLTGAPASAGVGKSFTMSNTVKTTGAVSRSFTVGLYLSTDNVITTSDTRIGTRTVASLKTNVSRAPPDERLTWGEKT